MQFCTFTGKFIGAVVAVFVFCCRPASIDITLGGMPLYPGHSDWLLPRAQLRGQSGPQVKVIGSLTLWHL